MRIGVDMIEVERIQRAVQRHGERFYKRFFTPAERAHCGDHPRRLAARFAAKEAVGKALGTGIGDIRWVDVEVLNNQNGRPFLNLSGEAAQLAEELGLTTWEVSMSHTDKHAIAFVVAT